LPSLWGVPGKLWTIARKIEEVLALQEKTKQGLADVNRRLDELDTRMIRLEAREGQVITEAKAASAAAATMVASAVISDIVTRVTRVEMRQDDLQKRLPPAI
jgi:hypothetical protein